MSSNESIFEERAWMYRRLDPLNVNGVSNEFLDGLNSFLEFAQSQRSYRIRGNLLCPCSRCLNRKRHDANMVGKHLYRKGFMDFYFIWTCHGEKCDYAGEASTSMAVEAENIEAFSNTNEFVDETGVNYPEENMGHQEFSETMMPNVESGNVFEEPCSDSNKFFKMLEEAQQPIYEGCVEGLSELSLSSRIMKIKTDHNLAEVCVDAISETFSDYLPPRNRAPKSYYETKKLTRSLGLPMQKIDVCQDNCMLFWKHDEKLVKCRFCGKDRYKPKARGGEGKNIPNQRMFYLPIADRLKRLYQSEKTASDMRWHAEHLSPEGEMHHPSDGEAWKHFHQVYPEFALEPRNVYLGLSTDGFKPTGMHSRDHSVWPVILTPYNLPPDMCMKKEYLFLSILVPGPKHPKKSLDIYLQPLIDELKELWTTGVQAYDVSKKQNFMMRAVLMWTISDFPAYAMLSGWMTHGRLACPYCLEDTQSFWLKHGRKHSWFDCHRRFLPEDHPYRKNVRSFTKNKSISVLPPPILTGEEVLYERINSIRGVFRSVDCGGNGHIPRNIDGYGDYHNWIKKSIFWDLPYWENQLLRHNLDVMHIEKNFFDNIMHTILNVAGKTKDNLKSRLDLPTVCRRKDLEVTTAGRAPVPIFRLSNEAKRIFLSWLKRDIRFPDGYVAYISACVDEETWKLTHLKSHDCHVIMHRLLPIAFAELLPQNVHSAIKGI